MTAKIISFEGIDGSGKSTIVKQISQKLISHGTKVLCLQEPGTTAMGLQIRSLLKSSINRSKLSELLLFEASRADMVKSVIMPAMTKYDYIFIDRYVDSTLAYQGYGNETNLDIIRIANKIAMQNIIPDKRILVDVSLKTASLRRQKRNNTDIDVFDSNYAFAKRVYDGYQDLVKSNELISVKNDDLKTTVERILSII